MITVIMAFLKEIPLKVWIYVAAAVVLVSLFGAQRIEIRGLKKDLAASTLAIKNLQMEGKATQASLVQAEKRAADVDLKTAWLLQSFGEALPKNDEEAKAWALKAAKEIGR